jgi:hypothetical protein
LRSLAGVHVARLATDESLIHFEACHRFYLVAPAGYDGAKTMQSSE